MASTISERLELAKLCSSKDWSKAIRILDSILSHSSLIQDICNRAFCYSQLELHKHVIKDCDKALQMDPTLLQAYILKGRAFSALGRKQDAMLVWKQGYECAIRQSADLKQLLELEELLEAAKQERSITSENIFTESLRYIHPPESGPHNLRKSDETHKDGSKLIDISESCSESNGESEICSKPNDKANVLKAFGDKSKKNNEIDNQSNGTLSIIHKMSGTAQSCSESRDTSDCESDTIHNKSNGSSKPPSKSSFLCETYGDPNDETKSNKKFCVTRISKTKSVSVDFQLSRGIGQVNEGKYAQAISIFDQILREHPSYPEALIGRGTSYAFQRELDAAIADFTKAIHFNPSASEAWKRRGQARAALGKSVEAIEDLSKALEFEPESADILHERGIVKFKCKDFNGAVEDLSMCVKLDKNNNSAYTFLGLALSSLGEYEMAEEAHRKSIQIDRSFVEAWAYLTQFYQDQANPTKALECIEQILKLDGNRSAKAYHLRGLLWHGIGNHRNAIKDLSIGLSIQKSNIELLYLRASCYHAIGEYSDAVKDYDAALDIELDSMEKFVLQCLAFYQKEIALYTASKINSEFCWFDIDGDIDPLFKEYWCKRLHPKNVCEKVFRQPPLRDSLKKGKLRKQDFSVTKQKAALLHAADSVGKKIQYNCPGFLPNRRQHRMAGLAAIEIAQKVSKAWRSLQAEWKYSNKSASKHGRKGRRKEKYSAPNQNRGGACCSSNSSETSTSYSVTEDRSSGRSLLSWQDVYSIAVKWRQIAEPCDPVVWVNRLSEEFNSGFGSHTPMILGQAKVVRYFPNYQRTLDVAKAVIKEKAYVYSKADNIIDLSQDGKIQEIMHADSCSDLYRTVGEDFWLATRCNSTAFKGKQLEGTRITLVKMGEYGFDFAIRTPCTPSRWEDFDVEMTMAWEAVCNAYCGETYGSTDFDLLENVRDAILRMTYYWYNFMPLSRGSAVVGFIVLLGLFLTANMKFTGNIPQGLQVDWEAILNFDPYSFVDSIKGWLYPSLELTASWKDYPDVASTFMTTGSVVAALSSYKD